MAPLRVYDFDGTLCLLPIDWKAVGEYVSKKYGAKWHDELPEPKRSEATEYVRNIEVDSIRGLKTNRDLCDKVKEFRKNGANQAVCSGNTRKAITIALEKTGILDCFQLLVCVEDVEKAKPDPEGLNKILGTLSTPPGHAIYYGNRPNDEQAAKQAGVKFVLIENVKWV